MSVNDISRRRIELGLGLRDLGDRTGILAGVLQDVELRGTFEHLTIAQLRRISRALDLDLDVLLALTEAEGSDAMRTDVLEQLSDAALAMLVEACQWEVKSNTWSPAINSDPPRSEISELLDAGALRVDRGRVFVERSVRASIALFSRDSPQRRRTVRFEPEFSAQIAKLRE